MKWILLLAYCYMSGSENIRESYIESHKDIAIVEMHRSGIPASVKLAQAILESHSGTSSFAISSNNHFGIKCKSYWKGNTYYHKDDDFDDEGQLLESCFRSYNRVMDSYIDHSNFLRESSHYAGLFLLPLSDYVGWAKGLQKNGYATDPHYARKLISIIEREELRRYDLM